MVPGLDTSCRVQSDRFAGHSGEPLRSPELPATLIVTPTSVKDNSESLNSHAIVNSVAPSPFPVRGSLRRSTGHAVAGETITINGTEVLGTRQLVR